MSLIYIQFKIWYFIWVLFHFCKFDIYIILFRMATFLFNIYNLLVRFPLLFCLWYVKNIPEYHNLSCSLKQTRQRPSCVKILFSTYMKGSIIALMAKIMFIQSIDGYIKLIYDLGRKKEMTPTRISFKILKIVVKYCIFLTSLPYS